VDSGAAVWLSSTRTAARLQVDNGHDSPRPAGSSASCGSAFGSSVLHVKGMSSIYTFSPGAAPKEPQDKHVDVSTKARGE
jgi:hypothetical protein